MSFECRFMGHETPPRAPQLALVPSPFCSPCPARGICREQLTELGCPPWGPVHTALLHPLSNDWFLRIVEIGNFAFDYTARAQTLPSLPAYIPAVRPNSWGGRSPSTDALALPLSHVEPLARNVTERGITVKQALGLAEHQLLIVLGFAADPFLERCWRHPDRRRLLTAIRVLEPDAAVAWGYSVWHRHARGWAYPRVEHLYNLKRSLKVYAELQTLGISAIPHIYWGTRDDLDRWADWLGANPSVTTLAVDLQTVDQLRAWRDALQALGYFRNMLPRSVHMLFNGVCRVERVAELRRLWPESSLCNFGAWFASAFRYKEPYGLVCPWAASPAQWSRADIFQQVVRQYTALGQSGEANQLASCPVDGDGASYEVRAIEAGPPGFPTARRRGAVWQRGFRDIDEQWEHAATRSVA